MEKFKTKRLLSIFLSLVMAISVFSAVAFAAETAAYDIDPNIDLAKVRWGIATTAYPTTPNLAYDYSFGQNWNGPPFVEGLTNNAAFPAANGTLKVAVIFMDCTDRRAEQVTQTSPVDYRTVAANFNVLSPLPDFYHKASYGRLNVELINVNALVNDGAWFRGTRTASQYNSSMSTQANEAIAFAGAAGFDFTDINYPAVFSPRGASIANSMTSHGTLTLPLPGGGSKVTRQYFNIGNNIWSWRRPWTILAHEMGHTLSMIDLYTYDYVKNENNNSDQWFQFIGGWDTEGDCNAHSPDNLAWHKWKLRWLEDEQVRVVVPNSSQTVTLTANAYWDEESDNRADDGIKMVYIPTETLREGTSTQTTTGYVIESRRPIGNDAPGPVAPGGSQAFAGAQDQGVLIYRVDSLGPNVTNGGHGRGGIKVIDGSPDGVNAGTQSSSNSLNTACFGFRDGQVQTFRDEGRNITIQVIARDDLTDTVVVTYGNPTITASQESMLAGDTATVKFTLDNSIGLASGTFDVLYDSALLNPVDYDCSNLPATAYSSVDLNYAPGVIRVAFDAEENVNLDDALFNLTFEAAAGAPADFDAEIDIVPADAAVDYEAIEMGPQFQAYNRSGTPTFMMNKYLRLNGIRPVNVSSVSGLVVKVPLVSATPTASVEKIKGNQNILTINLTELYLNGAEKVFTTTAIINNNAEGTYEVGDYLVYVNTKGNTQIRACYIVVDEVEEPIVDEESMEDEEPMEDEELMEDEEPMEEVGNF